MVWLSVGGLFNRKHKLLMKLASLLVLILLFFCYRSKAQDSTTTQLEDVVVKAYGNKSKQNTAAAILVINRSAFERNAGTSVVNTISSLPGIIMEERSPGSYRINIRGSSLRSPFGVRNVKVYYNDIPFSDAGGTTYLNALGTHNFKSVEIIKGPGSSMYGAGSGGVMLIEGADTATPNRASASYTYGSYNLHHAYAALNLANHSISYQHLQSNGYRDHSSLQRDVFSYTGTLLNKSKHYLRFNLLYSKMNYQTPGGLTQTEFTSNPKQSRPALGSFPSATQAKAAIYQNNLLTGINYRSVINGYLTQTSVVYFAYNTLNNPAIRNYGRNKEPHFGGRTQWTINKTLQSITFQTDGGIEFQQNLNRISIYNNSGGVPGSLQTDDRVHTRQYFAFVQSQLLWKRWIATVGASINQMEAKFKPIHAPNAITQQISFSNGLAPRVSLLTKLRNNLSLYTAIEKGFSPPSASELLPSGSQLNLSLRAESGWNKQLGIRGYLLKHLYADVNLFFFSLNNTIVQRRDAGGGEYFINGGSTKQHGTETYVNWRLFTRPGTIARSSLWLSHTWHSFKYGNFTQVNTDYSGNRIPGNAPMTAAAGFNLEMLYGFSAYATWQYSDDVFLNDANSAIASSYHLLGLKLSYSFQYKRSSLHVITGVDNLLNERYSNGNDINAAGGRYYNVAAGRNYWIQLRIDIKKK